MTEPEFNPWGQLLALAKPKPKRFAPRPVGPKPTLSPGDVVGEWTLLRFIPGTRTPAHVVARWLCRCSCGIERQVISGHLTSRKSLSCGHDQEVLGRGWYRRAA
jgi:hypothetical protein